MKDEVIYLMQERVGDAQCHTALDAQWQTLVYATGKDWQEADEWAKVCPRSIAVNGFPVYRRLVSLGPWID